MKSKKYDCDGGCILIGNSTCRFHIPNDFGDGTHKVQVLNADERISDKYRWLGRIEGNVIYVYSYDCLSENELGDNVLFSLAGNYHIYVSEGDVILKEERK